MKIKSSIFIGIIFLWSSFTLISAYAHTPDEIRVQILEDAPNFSLKISGYYEIMDYRHRNVFSSGRNLNTTIVPYSKGILIGGINFPVRRLFISVNDPDLIVINDRNFRGDVQIIKTSPSKLSVINYIDLEDYVKGVLYNEASHYWPMEALKAQAIVSRTYARYQMKQNYANDFDVTNSVYSQIYGGCTSERLRTNNAVEETKGLVLEYKGKIIPAYFHATCGGHTENASELWNINLLPLKGVVCKYCKDSPHFNWHAVLFTGDIRQDLVDAGKKSGVIKKIIILGRDDSGRITNLKIVNTKGELIILANDFRNIIGPNVIKSTNFNVSVIGTDAVFEGVGWGHGVGLCQWGAYFMAKDGASAEKILKYYYPSVDVKTF